VSALDDPLTSADLEKCGYQEILKKAALQPEFLASRFHEGATKATSGGEARRGRALALLTDLCSIPLRQFESDSPAGTRPLVTVDSFERSAVEALKGFLPSVEDPELTARIADFLWHRERDFKMAEKAVDAYLTSAARLEDPEHWLGCAERWKRALKLAQTLGRSRPLFDRCVGIVQDVVDRLDGEDPRFLSASLMEVLQESGTGDPVRYAAIAAKAARLAEASKDFHRARWYWGVQAGWHRLGRNNDARVAADVMFAETFIQEADEQVSKENPSYVAAAQLLRLALNCLRKLPGTRDQIANLEPRLREYERKSLDELRPIGPDFDPSELAEKARSAMRGKPLSEALPLLAAIVRPQSFSFHQELVEQAMKSSPVHHIFPLTLLNAEGAAIAQRSGLNSDTAKAEDPAFRAEMFRDMRLGHAVSVFGFIYPAKQQLLDEHDVRLADFRHLALCSSFVPPGREEIFARGLFAGMTDDYLTAAHLLVPQVENAIRYRHQAEGKSTTKPNRQGFDEEKDLGDLLWDPFTRKVLGTDLCFDLTGLLTHRFGYNMRNFLAHGLLRTEDFQTVPTIYFWWLCLHICYLMAVNPPTEPEAA